MWDSPRVFVDFCWCAIFWYQISFSQQKIARNRRLTLSSQKNREPRRRGTAHDCCIDIPAIDWNKRSSQHSFLPQASGHGGFFFKELLVGKGERLRKNTDMLKRTPYLVHYVVIIDYNNNNTNNNNNNN